MRSLKHRRPEVEALETMTLLSGMAGEALPAVAALKATPVVPHPLVLAGSIHGTFKLKGGEVTINASGSFGSFGKVTFTGSLALATATSENGTLTATSTKLGKLFVTLHETLSGTSASGTYTITGGTKAFAGETGSGVVSSTFTASKFTSTFSPAPTP
jgi:hypothetical protein